VNGALNTTPVPITCAITSAAGANTVVTCTATQSLGTSPRQYLASAVFLQTATPGQGGPAKVDPTVSTDASAQFFGSPSANIFAACGP
jgi:streptogramin lyase